jgi:hypothetical protein
LKSVQLGPVLGYDESWEAVRYALSQTYALKKAMTSITAQAEKVRSQADMARTQQDMKQAKRLKQDPVTGVYYAED